MHDCEYPDCTQCNQPECTAEAKDIAALLKRRRYMRSPELFRQRQRDYRDRVRANLPHCDQCDDCILVQKEKLDGYRRLCVSELRLIEQKVSNSPHWCRFRKEKDVGGKHKNQDRVVQ